jgi:hypothetical protein
MNWRSDILLAELSNSTAMNPEGVSVKRYRGSTTRSTPRLIMSDADIIKRAKFLAKYAKNGKKVQGRGLFKSFVDDDSFMPINDNDKGWKDARIEAFGSLEAWAKAREAREEQEQVDADAANLGEKVNGRGWFWLHVDDPYFMPKSANGEGWRNARIKAFGSLEAWANAREARRIVNAFTEYDNTY